MNKIKVNVPGGGEVWIFEKKKGKRGKNLEPLRTHERGLAKGETVGWRLAVVRQINSSAWGKKTTWTSLTVHEEGGEDSKPWSKPRSKEILRRNRSPIRLEEPWTKVKEGDDGEQKKKLTP